MLLVASSVVSNQSHVFPFLLSSILEKIRVEELQIQYITVGYFASGILGGFFVNYNVTKRNCSFRFLNIVIVSMCILSLIIFNLAYNYANSQIENETHIIDLDDLKYSTLLSWTICLTLCINGFFSLGYLSLCYVHVISLTPKIGESISCGIVNTLTNFISGMNLLSFVIQYGDEPDKMSKFGMFTRFYAFLLVATVIFFFIPNKRKIPRSSSYAV